jgi:hypothetical protein
MGDRGTWRTPQAPQPRQRPPLRRLWARLKAWRDGKPGAGKDEQTRRPRKRQRPGSLPAFSLFGSAVASAMSGDTALRRATAGVSTRGGEGWFCTVGKGRLSCRKAARNARFQVATGLTEVSADAAREAASGVDDLRLPRPAMRQRMRYALGPATLSRLDEMRRFGRRPGEATRSWTRLPEGDKAEAYETKRDHRPGRRLRNRRSAEIAADIRFELANRPRTRGPDEVSIRADVGEAEADGKVRADLASRDDARGERDALAC